MLAVRVPLNDANLVAPEKFVSVSILVSVPDMEELGDTMLPDMVSIFTCLVPCEWYSHGAK